MKKLLVLTAAAAMLTVTTQVFACDKLAPSPCPYGMKTEAPIAEFGGPQRMHRPPHCDMKKLEADLKLTDEQKAKVKAIRDKEREAIEPIRNQIKVKRDEMKKVFDERLTFTERQEKLAPIHKEIRDLERQIHKVRTEGRKEFKAILTDKQLQTLEKIKAEKKKEFEKRVKDGDFKRPPMHKRPPMPPVQCNCEKPADAAK